MQKDGIICFFYINNIMFAFKKDLYNKVEKTAAFYSKTLIIKRKRKLKWFLGLYIIYKYSKRGL